MTNVLERVHAALLKELRLMVGALAANLDVLGFLVKDLLQGEEEELLADAETFAAEVDGVLYHAAVAAIDCLDALRDQKLCLSPSDREQLALYAGQFDELTRNWTELVTAVNDVWKLRRPPH